MDEYIDRAAAISIFDRKSSGDALGDFLEDLHREVTIPAIKSIPAADVAPVVHARWKVLETHATTALYQCTACGEKMIDYLKREEYHRYCHRCGAKMDGGES